MSRNLSAIRRAKGEGLLPNLLLLIALGAVAYGVYHFFGKSPKSQPASSAPPVLERGGNDARPGSPAGAAVQQAQEMGSTAAQ